MHAQKYGFKQGNEVEVLDDEKNKAVAMEAAKKHFTPEFMNRLDHVEVFKTLTKLQAAEVMHIELGIVQQMFYTKARFLYQLTPAAKFTLMEEGYSIEYGARNLKRAIERRVRLPLAGLVSSGQILPGNTVVIDQASPKDTQFEFSIQKLSSTDVKFTDVENIL
jgi:ATP-dependent Clp protease ATP-binding subunit ClpA